MKTPIRSILFFLVTLHFGGYCQENNKIIARQGKVSFFSYTSVEDIEATNNQVYSLIDKANGKIAVGMLMRAFIFKKALMQEHFNESYVESDLYPKLEFSGHIQDFDNDVLNDGTRFVKGMMDFHGVKKEVEIKIKIENDGNTTILSGDFEVPVNDFKIKVPPLLAPNISKVIQVMFRFEYLPYEE